MPDVQQHHLVEILAGQRRAFRAEGTPGLEVRRERLQHVIDGVVKFHQPLVEAMDADFGGRPAGFSLMNDVLGSLAALKAARGSLEEWLAPDERAAYPPYDQLGATAYVRHDPKGTVGILGTWNAPLFTLLAPLAAVLAAGNRAILKPSEVTPRTAEVLAEAIASTCDPLEVAVVTGGPDVAEALTCLPLDHIVLTGGGHIGRIVMTNAAQNLVPVTLELGGKSPTVVSRSAETGKVAFHIAAGKWMNAGQLCVSPDLVYVPRETAEEFVTALQQHYAELIPTVQDNTDLVAVVNDRHLARVEDLVQDASDRGARIETSPAGASSGSGSRRRPLSIVVDPPTGARVLEDEIFGPAVVVLPYDEVDEVIADIHRRPHPLALYYFGHDEAEKQHVLDHTSSGGVTINGIALHPGMSQAPFGGAGGSGMGHYNGREGFLEFSHARTVFEAPAVDMRREWGMLPPYGAEFAATMASMVTA